MRNTPRDSADRIWTRDFILALSVNFALASVFYLLMTTMALYAVERFAANDSLAGLTASAYVLGAVLSRLLASKYLDFVGRKRTIVICLSAFVVLCLLYFATTSLAALIVLRFVHGMAFGAASTAVAASAISLVPTAKRGEGAGYFSISATLAVGVGPLIGTLLIDGVGYEGLFWASTIASIIGLTAALAIRLPERDLSEEELRTKWRIRLSDLLEARAMPIASIVFLACFAYSGVLAFYLNYADAAGRASVAAAFFTTYSIAVFVVRLIAGRVQDRFGDNAVFLPTLGLFAVGLVVLSLPPALPLAIAGGALVAFGFGTIMPGGQAAAVSSTSPARVGVATSTFFIMADSAIGVGPIVLGGLLHVTGYNGMYLCLAGLVVVTIGVYALTHGRARATAATRIT